MIRLLSLDTVYATTAVVTLLVGLIGLTSGVRSEIVSPVVMVGAVVVGLLSVFWLVSGEGVRGQE